MKSQTGMSLVGVLVAVAVVGILAATLSSIYEGMSRTMQRTSTQNEVDNIQRYIQGVLSQKVLCDGALRQTYKGARINWNYTSQPYGPIPVIQFWDPNPPPNGNAISVLASTLTGINLDTGLPYNQVTTGLTVKDIRIQLPDPNGDGVPDYTVQTVIRNNAWLTIVPAEILITFQGSAIWSGGIFRPRAIPVVAYFDALYNLVECDVVDSNPKPQKTKICDLQAAYDEKGYTNATGCPQVNGVKGNCPTGPRNGLAQIAFFDGYDTGGNPICNCQRICGQGPPANPGVNPMSPSQ